MAPIRVGVIGTGKPRGTDGSTGYGMAYQHGNGYRMAGDRARMVAVADIVQENADAYCAEFGIGRTYADYREMLASEDLDMVSICVWPALHEQMAVDCTEAGVRAVHCEKPMAPTWGAARHMAAACQEHGTQLTFNHMRRFGLPNRLARELADAGEIGELVRVEFGGGNFCDYGSHQFDSSNYFVDQAPVEWLLAQIDYSVERLVFGEPQETQGVAVWQYASGVQGLAIVGRRAGVGCHNRLVGSEGVIELDADGYGGSRVRRKGSGEWERLDTQGQNVHGPGNHERAVLRAIDCLEKGVEPEHGANNALQATEMIFACWESSRRRGRVDMPLDVDDNALVAMVESGELTPAPRK